MRARTTWFAAVIGLVAGVVAAGFAGAADVIVQPGQAPVWCNRASRR